MDEEEINNLSEPWRTIYKSEKKMKEEINRIAKEMYSFAMMDRIEQEPWKQLSTEQKMYYRRMALWHMNEIAPYEKVVDDVKGRIIHQLERLNLELKGIET